MNAYIVAESSNAALVKTAREACPKVRGALIFDSLETPAARKNAFVRVNRHLGYVAISRTAPSDETVTYFNARVMPVWGFALGALQWPLIGGCDHCWLSLLFVFLTPGLRSNTLLFWLRGRSSWMAPKKLHTALAS